MFVDVGDNRAVLENLSLSFVSETHFLYPLTHALTSVQVYDEVVENPYEDTGGDDITALTGVQNEYFPDMREWICDYLCSVEKKVSVAIQCVIGSLRSSCVVM